MSTMFLAMQQAMKHNEIKQVLKQQAQEKLVKKKLDEKEWEVVILTTGGVSYWKQEYTDSNGKTKIKNVKITVVPQNSEVTYTNKGKFSFKDGLGNRVHVSCKTYKDAEQFMAEFYGVKKYNISCAAI